MPKYTLYLAASAIIVWQVLFCGIAAAETFPWTTPQTLASKEGKLTWTVTKKEGEFVIEGKHPKWEVTHRCALDGTPKETVRRAKGHTVKLTWNATGVEVIQDEGTKSAKVTQVSEKGLWDGDTLDARLAGLPWAKDKKYEFRIIDTDDKVGNVVPMRAVYEAQEKCSEGPCHHVVLSYTGFGSSFVADWHYRYSTSADARYLSYEHEKETFKLAAK
jgi:hypothetical protein